MKYGAGMVIEKILTVSQLTGAIKGLLETGLDQVWVSGEISNLRCPASGHIYATLKDASSQIRMVAFKSAAARLGFDIEEGMEILCRGRVNVYPVRGEYQLIIDAAEPKGIGALQLAFEQLKMRLEKEGLFDTLHKKEIPFLPETIGIVTSPSGSVVRDILTITGRRFPSVNIVIAPAAVQGRDAPAEICNAIADLNEIGVDVIIVARGGGSLEDLFCFNDEGVARAIYGSSVPVISAVGHETDFTISDFVADLRAPTPSAAAELVVPDRRDILERLQRLRSRLVHICDMSLRELRTRLIFTSEDISDPKAGISELRDRLEDRHRRLKGSVVRLLAMQENRRYPIFKIFMSLSPSGQIRELKKRVGELKARLEEMILTRINGLEDVVQGNMSLLDTLSPLSVLKRGFGIVRLSDRTLVRDAGMLTVDDMVDVRLSSGSFTAKVITIIGE